MGKRILGGSSLSCLVGEVLKSEVYYWVGVDPGRF